MKLKSMTGFGESRQKEIKGEVLVEIKSINSRYCEVRVETTPRQLQLEFEIEKLIKKHVSRGKLEVTVKWIQNKKQSQAVMQEEKIIHHFQAMEKIRKKLKLQTPVSLESLIGVNRGWFFSDDVLSLPSQTTFLKGVMKALAVLDRSRSAEGLSLGRGMKVRLDGVEKSINHVAKIAHQELNQRKSELIKKVKTLSQTSEAEAKRFESELIVGIDKLDVTEELERLEVHVQKMKKILMHSPLVGREMDFLLQEINREINTVGSKSISLKIKDEVVFLKTECEKIREQIQNLE